MKILTFIFALLFALPVAAQSVRDTKVRIRDNTDNSMMVDVQAYTATLAATIRGVAGLSVTYFLDTVAGVPQVLNGFTATVAPTVMPNAPWSLGLNYYYDLDITAPQIWTGREMDIDDIPVTTRAPYTGSFLHGFDDVNNDWDRLAGLDITLSAKDMFGLLVFSATGYHNLSDGWFTDWQGDALNSDSIPNTQGAPYVGSFLHGWHASDALWQRIVILDAADGVALSNHGLMTYSAMAGYNGATLDMVRLSADKSLHVVDTSVRPGEDAANDLRKVSKVDVGTYSPAKTTTATVGTAEVIVLASTEILDLPNVCIYLHNTDGADSFTDASIYVSPEGSTFISLGWASCNTLGFGEACVYCLSNHAYRYIKVGVSAADANQVSVDAFLTGNKN